MKIIVVCDQHRKHEEPFFRAGVALDDYIIEQLRAENEKFVYLDGGDGFHVSKETGRVNGEVVRFFQEIAKIPNCEAIWVMQGNHDVKEDTGSALDLIQGLHLKIRVVDTPQIIYGIGDSELNTIYLLPHMRPFSFPGYSSIKSYSDESFHRELWKERNCDWDMIKDNIKMVSIHGGDETTGKLFMNVDISFLPGIRANGHIHKQISKNHVPSAAVTRRDEIDKKCVMRYIDTQDWSFKDVEIPLFLNYARIAYGEDIDNYFRSGVHVMSKESLIVDIYGHDDEHLVAAEYSEKWRDRQNPKLYVGEVTPVERRGEAVSVEERDSLDIASINITELFKEFCEEKKLGKAVVDDLIARIA